jgi:hypothetical protein
MIQPVAGEHPGPLALVEVKKGAEGIPECIRIPRIGRKKTHMLRERVQTKDTLRCGTPEIALIVRRQHADLVILHGLVGISMHIKGLEAVTVETVQAILRGDPDDPPVILHNIIHLVIG